MTTLQSSQSTIQRLVRDSQVDNNHWIAIPKAPLGAINVRHYAPRATTARPEPQKERFKSQLWSAEDTLSFSLLKMSETCSVLRLSSSQITSNIGFVTSSAALLS